MKMDRFGNMRSEVNGQVHAENGRLEVNCSITVPATQWSERKCGLRAHIMRTLEAFCRFACAESHERGKVQGAMPDRDYHHPPCKNPLMPHDGDQYVLYHYRYPTHSGYQHPKLKSHGIQQ